MFTGFEDLPTERSYKKRKKRILICFHDRARVVLTILCTLKLTPFLRNFPSSVQSNLDAEDPLKDMVPETSLPGSSLIEYLSGSYNKFWRGIGAWQRYRGYRICQKNANICVVYLE